MLHTKLDPTSNRVFLHPQKMFNWVHSYRHPRIDKEKSNSNEPEDSSQCVFTTKNSKPCAYDTNLVNVELSTLLFLARGALTGCVTLFVVCCLTALSKVLRSSDKAAFFPLITSYILVYKPQKNHPININKHQSCCLAEIANRQ